MGESTWTKCSTGRRADEIQVCEQASTGSGQGTGSTTPTLHRQHTEGERQGTLGKQRQRDKSSRPQHNQLIEDFQSGFRAHHSIVSTCDNH